MSEESQIEPGYEPPNEYDRIMVPYIRVWGNVLLMGLRDAVDFIESANGGFVTPEELMEIDNLESRKAVRWVLSNNRKPRSFCWICDILGFDAEYIRIHLLINKRKTNTI